MYIAAQTTENKKIQQAKPEASDELKKMMMSLLGVSKVAYVKPVDGVFAVHGADGTELATFDTLAEAHEKVALHQLELVSVQ